MYVAALFLLALVLSTQWVMVAVSRWGLVAGLALFYELRILKKILPWYAVKGQEERIELQPCDKILILSGLFHALLAGFLMVTSPQGWLSWIPALVAFAGLVAMLTSHILADKHSAISVGYEILAGEFRALGALALTAILVHYGKLDTWFILIGAMEYLLLFTRGWLHRKGKSQQQELSPQLRLRLLYLYLAILNILLLPVGQSNALSLVVLIFGLLYFMAALRDWFILAGMLDPKQSQIQQIANAIKQALTGWVALSIRLLAAMAVATVTADMVFHFDMYAQSLRSDIFAGMIVLALLTSLPFLLFGIQSRWFALLSFGAFMSILLTMGQNTVIIVGLILSGLTIILGQGNYSSTSSNPR